MDVREGDRVLVNVAAFIGSAQRKAEAIPCTVLAVDGPHLEIRTQPPYREFSMRVDKTWIDEERHARA
jgi:hypothetical protein